MSSSRRWASSGSTDVLPSRSSALPTEALSPARHSSRRSVSRSEVEEHAAGAGVVRSLWPSSSSNSKKAAASLSPSAAAAVATLADHLTNDATMDAPSLSRQRSCSELRRSADAADADERKITRSSHAFGRSMRFLPSTKPAGVTLTPGRVAPSDLRRLNAAGSGSSALDSRAEVASSGSECSEASRGSTHTSARPAIPKPGSPLIGRTSSVRLLGSSSTQWALSPGRRSSSPLKTLATAVTEPKSKKSLLSMGWGHLFNRRKTDADAYVPTTAAAAAAAVSSSSPVPRSGAAVGEAGHQMRMMHCQLLRWRLVNAKADTACKNKLAIAEVQLMGTWASMSEIRGKVARRRVQLEKEKLKIKLNAILSSQMRDLESWGQLERKHVFALDSTVDSAKAAVCRLPLTNGAKVSLPAMTSILEQMFELAMTARISIRSFSPTAQDTAVLMSQLVRVAREERALLQECLELLGRVSALQIKEQSLLCHKVQSSSLNLGTLD